MAIVFDLKPKFQALLRPMMKSFANKGHTPNYVKSLYMKSNSEVYQDFLDGK